MNCENCGERYDPNATGWKCPSCGWKDHCCDTTFRFNLPADIALPTWYELHKGCY